MRPEEFPHVVASHMVKSIDLNHHQTLFAGRMSEWMVETAFMTARNALACHPGNLVCKRVHKLDFRKPVPAGETFVLEGRVAHVGRTSISVYIEGYILVPQSAPVVTADGFVSFVHVTEGTDNIRPLPHGVNAEAPQDPKAIELWQYIEQERGGERPQQPAAPSVAR
ncbi:putative Thioesterase superfamily [Paratrimastix pyriformis]|uniref:Thioesterase superfamily n=1 Tax=Paratrimastix pyriformis TaxID=342808 RepID=A0ABQ8UXB0_9EUKA|nr:putative Thioesterase superfamily [Paratrimastix pyriformis]|eukprot:GAFH01005808.1.p1 GENE.GAFH01005808.1~~GAFH01005808.1.p1  ORF type:complete len:174 (+),score=12.29 GAFH01005808.1:24-524(+)